MLYNSELITDLEIKHYKKTFAISLVNKFWYIKAYEQKCTKDNLSVLNYT
jgi:hypothetical protein